MSHQGPPPAATAPDTREQQRALVQQWIARAEGNRDLFDYIAEHAHADLIVHTPDGRTGDIVTLVEYATRLRNAYPDLTARLEAISFSTDRLIIQATLTPHPDTPTDEPTAEYPTAIIARIDPTSRVREIWGYTALE